MQLVESVYRLTSTFPKEEQYGLTSQMRRAAVSVPSNIAEGAARNTSKELIYFLGISIGSLAELDTQLDLATRLGLCKAPEEIQALLNETTALTLALSKSIKAKIN